MVYKRYEYWTREGKVWSDWFPWDSDLRDKWQLNNRLRNEYLIDDADDEDEDA